MGAVAARLADHVVVTSDNPRSEDPAAIISDVIDGVSAADGGTGGGRAGPPGGDRRWRSAQAGAGDVVVVAGKGHETTQTIGDQVLPFDDRRAVVSGAPPMIAVMIAGIVGRNPVAAR